MSKPLDGLRVLDFSHALAGPYCATADRPIALAVASGKLWAGFCQAVERPEWTTDPRFASNPQRVVHRGELEPAICRLLEQRPAAEWLAIFGRRGVPVTVVRTLAEVVADPQSEARQMFPRLPHAEAGEIRVTGVPVKLSETPGAIERPAPLPGEHTAEVLARWLGESPLH